MNGKCQLCGQEGKLTKEHLPQRALYPKTIRDQITLFNTVFACFACNNDSKVTDEFAKVVIGSLAEAPWKDTLRDSVDSTLSKNRRLDRFVKDNTRESKVKMEDGTLRNATITSLSLEHSTELMGAIEKMVKAFFFMEYGQVLVEHFEVSVFMRDGLHPRMTEAIYKGLASTEWKYVNENTICYKFFRTFGTDQVCAVNIFKNMEHFFALKELGWRDKDD